MAVAAIENYPVRRVTMKAKGSPGRRRIAGRSRFSYDGTRVVLTAERGTAVVAEGTVTDIAEGGCSCGGRKGWNVTLDDGTYWIVQG